MYGNTQQMQLQQIQEMMSQLAGLMQQVNSVQPPEPVPAGVPALSPQPKELRTIQYADGIEDAKNKQRDLLPGESMILMDSGEAKFYAISKDKEGKSPRKIPVGSFTMGEEPDPPQYVTQADLADFKKDILEAIKGGNA